MQFCGSSWQSISQRKRSQAIHPIGGVLSNPLSRAAVSEIRAKRWVPAMSLILPINTKQFNTFWSLTQWLFNYILFFRASYISRHLKHLYCSLTDYSLTDLTEASATHNMTSRQMCELRCHLYTHTLRKSCFMTEKRDHEQLKSSSPVNLQLQCSHRLITGFCTSWNLPSTKQCKLFLVRSDDCHVTFRHHMIKQENRSRI